MIFKIKLIFHWIKIFIYSFLYKINILNIHSPFVYNFHDTVVNSNGNFSLLENFKKKNKELFTRKNHRKITFLFKCVNYFKVKSVYVDCNDFFYLLTVGSAVYKGNISIKNIDLFSDSQLEVLEKNNIKIKKNTLPELAFFFDIVNIDIKTIINYKFVIIYKPYKDKKSKYIWNNISYLPKFKILIDLYDFAILVNINASRNKFYFRYR